MRRCSSLALTILIYIVCLASLHSSVTLTRPLVIHWPVAFKPGPDLFPPHPEKPNEVALDLETSLVDTWNAMIKLRDTGKVTAPARPAYLC
jgi:diketogulonate reductase-like aldo/keto reductase